MKNKEPFWTGDGLWERSKRLDPIPHRSIEEVYRALDNKISAAGKKQKNKKYYDRYLK